MFRRILCEFQRELVPSPFNQVQVRWRKKPRWLPMAKTKIFRIPPRRRYPSDELDEVKRLHNVYRSQMKSLREFFAERTKAMSTGESVLAEIIKREEEAHEEAVKINEKWNAELAQHRLKVLAAEKEEEVLKILEAVEQSKIEAREMKQKAEEIVRLEKEKAKHYITPENIDDAIDKALETTVDYEFAIDIRENIYHGRRTKHTTESSEEEGGLKVATSA